MAVLIGVAVWAGIIAGGYLLLRVAGWLLWLRPVTAPFQFGVVRRWRWAPRVVAVYRTCGDCGERARLAVEEDYAEALAGDLTPSRCAGCRRLWLASNPLAIRPGIMGRVSVGEPDHPAV